MKTNVDDPEIPGMEPMTSAQIRAGLVNCTKGEAKRLWVPTSLDSTPWQDLDFLGWRDPSSPLLGGIALWWQGDVVSIALKATTRGGGGKQSMCSLCTTFHSSGDIVFMGAKFAGNRGRDGDTIAASMCADLACSLYARKKKTPNRVQPQETIDLHARVQRLQVHLATFVARVLDGS